MPIIINRKGMRAVIRATANTTVTMNDLAYKTTGTGTISSATNSVIVTGSGTNFTSNLVNYLVYHSNNSVIGMVNSVTNATSLTLKANAAIATVANTFQLGSEIMTEFTISKVYWSASQNSSNKDTTITVGRGTSNDLLYLNYSDHWKFDVDGFNLDEYANSDLYITIDPTSQSTCIVEVHKKSYSYISDYIGANRP